MTTRAPANDVELIRSLHERIRDLEYPSTQRVGEWVLSSKSGLLTATKPGLGPITLGGGEALDFADEIQTSIKHQLKGYVTGVDLADALGGFKGVDTSNLASILGEVKTWATNLLQLGPIVEALTGVLGGLPDLTTWAAGLPTIPDIVESIVGAGYSTLNQLRSWGTVVRSTIGSVANLQSSVDLLKSITQTVGQSIGGVVDAFVNIFNGTALADFELSDLVAAIQAIPGNFINGALTAATIAGNAITSVLDALNIPGLDTSKIITGTFADGILPGLGSLRDAISQAINGGATTGYTTAQVKTALLNIPGANVVSSILASIVPALDASKITTGVFSSGLIPALAISGITSLSGYLTNLTSGGVWSGALTSAATVGGNAITTLLGNITSGGLFDSGKLSNVTGTIGAALISALDASKITTGTFTDAYLPGLGSLRDAISQAIAGGATTGYTAANVKAFLQAIPHGNVIGNLGGVTIGNTAQAIVDFATQALSGVAGTGNSLGAFGNLLALLNNTANTGASTAQAASITLNNRAIYNPLGHAVDPTARATFDISAMITTGTLPTFNVTAAAPAIGFIGFPDPGTEKSVWWYAPAVPGATISALTINVYRLNTSTGAVDFLCTSGNMVGSAIVGWNNYAISTPDWITVAQGDILAVEMVIRSTSASYAIAGIANSPVGPHPSSQPRAIGATRAIPANVTTAVTGVSVPAGTNGAVVRLVGGGGGGSGSGINGANSGPGGGGGGMVDVTVPGSSLGATYTTVAGGAGGGGASSGNGSAGGASTFVSGSTSLSAGGGAAGNRTGSAGGSGGTNSISGSGLTTNTNATGGAGANGSGSGGGNNGSNGSGTGSAAGGGSGGAGTGTTSGGSGGSAQPTGGAGGTGSTGTGGAGQVMTTLVGSGGAGGGGGLNTVGNAGAGGTGGTYGGGGGGAGSKSGATGGVSGGSGGPGGVLVQWIAATTSFTPTYSSTPNIPWFAMSASEGVAQIPQATSLFDTSGAHTYTVPTQFQYAGALFDVIVLGGGAGGSTPAQNLGGTGGNFTVVSNLVYGTDIPLGTTSFSVSVGAGGAGVISGARNNGGSTTVTIPTYGTITATGGSSSTGVNAGGNTNPTTELVNGTLYQGGLGGSTSFDDGHTPGGGGGGNAGVGGTAGSGATGAAWVTAHQ